MKYTDFRERPECVMHTLDAGSVRDYDAIGKCACVIRYLRGQGTDDAAIRQIVLRLLKKEYYFAGSIRDQWEMANDVADDAFSLAMLFQFGEDKESISFTKSELEFIRSQSDNIAVQCTMFCAYAIYKYYAYSSSFMVNFIDAWKIAQTGKPSNNIMTGFPWQTVIYKDKFYIIIPQALKEMADDGNKALVIANFINLPFYFLEYYGISKFRRCERCGCIISSEGHGRKYCADCARNAKRENDIARIQIVRKLQKAEKA